VTEPVTDPAGAPEESGDPLALQATEPAASVRAARGGRYRDALRYRDLRLLIAAFLIDQIGSWSYAVVISVYIFDRTHSTQWLAAAGICRWGPNLLLASYGGVIADRYQRTTVLIVSSLISAVLMAGMAVAVGTDAPVAYVLVITALSSAALAPYRPAAGALTPEVVGERDLAAANSIFSGLENLVVVVGPGIGGLLLLTGRPVIGVAINAASLVAAAAIVVRLRVRSTGSGAGDGNAWRQFTIGLGALGRQPVALAIILLAALDSAVYGASTVLYVPLSVRLGTGTQRLQLPAGRGGARRGSGHRPGQPAERRVPAGAGHHGQPLPAGSPVPDHGAGTLARPGLHPAGAFRGGHGHRGRAGHHQPAA
jgi:MFS family permease